MTHTFLHLSDLHYRPDWHEESELILTRFHEDAKEQLARSVTPYLLFSGDLVQSGEENSYYVAFQQKLETILTDLRIPKARRICVPGNHDVSRQSIKASISIQRGALSVLNSEESFNREFEPLSELFFSSRFANYRSAELDFANYTCCHSGLGGTGWTLSGDIGVFCLNSALCSFGGLEDPETQTKISDRELLMVHTRPLHQWLQTTATPLRILVMHHPLEWLKEWSRSEISTVIANYFRLVVTGHVHNGNSVYSSNGANGCVHCIAPALFTRKRDELGYSIIEIDSTQNTVDIKYRQKTATHKFVAGSILADNDTGIKSFPFASTIIAAPRPAVREETMDTRAILEAEFIEAATSYSSKKPIWVDRDLSSLSETAPNRDGSVKFDPADIALTLRNCIIRAPKEFGLSCLGKFLALKAYADSAVPKLIVYCDSNEIPTHRRGILDWVSNRCKELGAEPNDAVAFILDNWTSEQNSNKLLKLFRAEYTNKPLIILQGFDDFQHIINAISIEGTEGFEVFYLWSLTRGRVRELVTAYLSQCDLGLDESIVTKRLLEDLDVLNIHRSPVNCLLLLNLLERAFDDSPVNRTEAIGKVLYFLFHEFDQIPRYSSRPDLKDCEHALGYFCEWMIRESRRSFTLTEFTEKISSYCKRQLINVDVNVLFAFLATENIFIKRGHQFSFRLTFWPYYFAAHRMYHDNQFADYILSDSRYAAFPEIIEFYTGIDRQRGDAVERLTVDLNRMDEAFLQRSGIINDFNPFAKALWAPNEESIGRMEQGVLDSIKESSLPSAVKDTLADKGYDNAKPYHQEVAEFLTQSSLRQMEQAMKGASRALRNSDYVSPEVKAKLLDAVVRCWIRMCQTLVTLSPLLAANRRANFDGLGFFLDKTFDHLTTPKEVWNALMGSILENVVDWYASDIYSKKLGALLENYVKANESLGELLILMLTIKQRPIGWDQTVRAFILKTHKNAYYLAKVQGLLWHEFRTSFAPERVRQELRALGAMCVAKHSGAKNPSASVIEKAALFLEKQQKERDQRAKEQ